MKILAPNRFFVKDALQFLKMPDSYDLRTVTFITEPAAEELARFEGRINLSRFKEIPTKILSILSHGKITKLVLNGLTSLEPFVVSSLRDFRGELYLNGVKSLNIETARELMSLCAEKIFLNGLQFIELDSLEIVSSNYNLFIPEILRKKAPNKIDLESAIRFLEDQNSILIRVARELTDEGASVLANYTGTLDLTGLVKISDESCRLLANHTGQIHLSFQNLEMSFDGAQSLLQHNPHPGNYHELIRFLLRERITTECAKWISQLHDDRNLMILSISNARFMSDEAAEILATVKTPRLPLGSIEHLSDFAAAALSRFQGEVIELNGLKSLSMPAARSLMEFKGMICITELKSVDSESAKMLLKHQLYLRTESARLEELKRVERERLVEEARIERKYLEEKERAERLHLEKINAERVREAELEKEFASAIKYLEYLKEYIPPEKSNSTILNVLKKSIFGEKSHDQFRTEIIEKAKNLTRISSRANLKKYIIESGLQNDSLDFTVKRYSRMYFRTTHCFRCQTRLVSTISNECGSCGWILCACGACGCNYHRIRRGF